MGHKSYFKGRSSVLIRKLHNNNSRYRRRKHEKISFCFTYSRTCNWLFGSPAVTKSGTIYFPLWLSYATGVLDKEGHNIRLIDAPAKCWTKEHTLEEITAFNPDFVVIDTSTPSINNDLAFTKAIKEKLPNTKTCLVGTHVSATVSEILPEKADYVDFIARHEY